MAPVGPSPLIAPPWGATSYPPLCGWYLIVLPSLAGNRPFGLNAAPTLEFLQIPPGNRLESAD